MPLRSSLKKPKNKDHSITSDSSSKRVRYGLGGEQTNVWEQNFSNLFKKMLDFKILLPHPPSAVAAAGAARWCGFQVPDGLLS